MCSTDKLNDKTTQTEFNKKVVNLINLDINILNKNYLSLF